MTSSPALEILRTGARALASGTDPESTLVALLRVAADELGIDSAAVFVADRTGSLGIVASIGVGDPAGLTAAVRNPGHPVARAALEGAAEFDVRPMAAGGPALRSHLPLAITGKDGQVTAGVLALAYDRPTDPEARSILEAVGDLIVVAIERDRGSI